MHRKEYYDPILKTRPPNKEKNKFFNLENKIKKRPLRPLSRFLSIIDSNEASNASKFQNSRHSKTFDEKINKQIQKNLCLQKKNKLKRNSNTSIESNLMKTIKKNISKFNFSFKKKTTHIFIASSLSQKKLKYFRVVSYIRSNLKKITSLSQTYRKRNLKKFHYYLIGDLATNSLIGNGTNFAYEITKSLKQLENKIKVFDNNVFLNNFLPKSKTTQLSANFYLQSYNRLYKYWIPFNKKFTFLKKIIKKIFSVILPNSPIKIGYEIFSFFMIIFTLLFLPLHNIFWAHQNKNLFPLLLVVIFFFCELFMAFNTAYIKNGIIYNERKKIFLYSINVNTILDIFFLYFSIESFETNNEKEEFYYQELTHLIGTQMTNILIVYKVIRMSEILIYIEDYFLNLNERNSIIIRMTKLLAFNLICAHLISCSWISICFYDEGNQNSNCSAGLNFKRSNWFEIYIYGLYWAVTTMLTVGYGDITPTRNLELIFSILAMIFSCCLYGYTMNTVGVILKDYNNQENNLKKQQNIINFYLKEKGVDSKLQMRIKKHLVDVWQAKKNNLMTTQRLMEMVPSDYKLELLLQIYGRPLLKNKVILRWFGLETLTKLCLLCKEKFYLPNEIIYSENILDDCSYYFIESGRVEFFLKKDQQMFLLNILSETVWFGELAFFTNTEQIESAKSIKYSTIITLERENFLKILSESPKNYEKFCFIKDKIKLYELYSPISLYCMSCNSTQHITKNCNLITFYPKETICLKHQFNLINTDRVYYDRNDSRKKNSLKDINKYVASLKRFILKNSKEIKALRKIIKGAEQKEKAEALQTIYSYNSDDGDAEELKNNLEELIPLGNEGEFEKKIEERNIISPKHKKSIEWKETATSKLSSQKKEKDMCNFEKMKQYQFYFPQNNFNHVIKKHKIKNELKIQT